MVNKPTVTDLIKLLDKPALLGWANRIGLDGIKLDDYRKKSTTTGTSLHKQIEMYVKEKKPFENLVHQQSFDKYFFDKEILSIETNIETEWFKGRMDLKIGYKGKTYVCDFKSNQSSVYFENKLQLSAYRMAENADGVGIISIPDFTFIPVIIKDFTPYQEILKLLSRIYYLKQSLF